MGITPRAVWARRTAFSLAEGQGTAERVSGAGEAASAFVWVTQAEADPPVLGWRGVGCRKLRGAEHRNPE